MTKNITKKARALKNWQAELDILQCPLCGSNFKITEDSGFSCAQGHSFDLARKGYLNLFLGQQKGQYTRKLFQARRQVFAAGVYDPLLIKLSSILTAECGTTPFVLDAGCGEGSVLAKLSHWHPRGKFLGVDLAKEGIQQATLYSAPILWLVADLANLPLQTNSMDFILNILSPANYGEFKRVLKPNGKIIKVLPGPEYLAEIRSRLQETDAYSNQEVLDHLARNVNIETQFDLQYQIPVTTELWTDLIAMTPLTEHRIVEKGVPDTLTLDFVIIQAMGNSN